MAQKFALRVRAAIDGVLYAQTTGRWKVEQLLSNEKTFIGTRIELEFQDLLEARRGTHLDLDIDGVNVDVKFSLTKKWMLPKQHIGQICLVVYGDDVTGKFGVGVVRFGKKHLGTDNRDKKKGALVASHRDVRWLVEIDDFPVHFFFGVEADVLKSIYAERKGQPRVNKLFEIITLRKIPRYVITTLGMQADSMRRARGGDGGVKQVLWENGLIRIGGTYKKDRALLAQMGLAPEISTLKRDEYISVPIAEIRSSAKNAVVEEYRQKNKLPPLPPVPPP